MQPPFSAGNLIMCGSEYALQPQASCIVAQLGAVANYKGPRLCDVIGNFVFRVHSNVHIRAVGGWREGGDGR